MVWLINVPEIQPVGAKSAMVCYPETRNTCASACAVIDAPAVCPARNEIRSPTTHDRITDVFTDQP